MKSLTRIALVLVAGVAIAPAGCSKPQVTREPTVPVRIAEVQRGDAPLVLSANGIVEPRQTVSVEAQIGGVLTEVSFREGDDVEAGQVLFRIDPRPLEAALRQAQAALARDIAQMESASREAERYRTLVAKDYVTRSQADQAAATAAAMRATVRSDSASVDNAQLNLAYSTIRSPIAGRTGSLLVRQGNVVRPGANPLVVINQLHPILVRFPVPQRDFLALAHRSAGRNVAVTAVTADSLPVGEPGMLTFIDNAVDSLTGTVTAKAEFTNGKATLWPGAYVRVDVQLDVLRNALTVPSQAILTGQQGTYVYVIDSQHEARMRPVAVGRMLGTRVVVDTGLVAGEHVVIDGQSRLVPGSKVDVQTGERGAR